MKYQDVIEHKPLIFMTSLNSNVTWPSIFCPAMYTGCLLFKTMSNAINLPIFTKSKCISWLTNHHSVAKISFNTIHCKKRMLKIPVTYPFRRVIVIKRKIEHCFISNRCQQMYRLRIQEWTLTIFPLKNFYNYKCIIFYCSQYVFYSHIYRHV
jgi:hypothetical protein